MESVGTQIRTARLETGLSLEQISANTRISVRNLQAIEEDDFHQITSAFFYKSFVKQFCSQIEFPVGRLYEAIALAVAAFPEPNTSGHGEALIRNTVVRPLKRKRQVRWLVPAMSLAVVLMACSGFYEFWERVRIRSPRTVVQRSTPAHDWSRSAAHSPAETPAIAEPKAVVPAEPDGRFRVELSAVERTWLSIRADGKPVYSGTLEVDQTKVLEGREEGLVRTGNAGGVNIVFNGKPIGLAGPHGSIRTVVFTRDNYEVLPDPVRTAFLQPFSSQLTWIDGWLRLPLVP